LKQKFAMELAKVLDVGGTELIIIPVRAGIQKAPQNNSMQTKKPVATLLFVKTELAQHVNATVKAATQMDRAF